MIRTHGWIKASIIGTDKTSVNIHQVKKTLVLSDTEFGIGNKDMQKNTQQVTQVLLVDDMLTSRQLIKLCLNQDQYQVEEASSAEEAIDKLQQNSFDIAILDVMMPGMDGIELCTLIRKDAKYARLPVIMMTSLDSSADIKEINDAGATRYIKKPFNVDELKSVIQQLTRP